MRATLLKIEYYGEGGLGFFISMAHVGENQVALFKTCGSDLAGGVVKGLEIVLRGVVDVI